MILQIFKNGQLTSAYKILQYHLTKEDDCVFFSQNGIMIKYNKKERNLSVDKTRYFRHSNPPFEKLNWDGMPETMSNGITEYVNEEDWTKLLLTTENNISLLECKK